MINTENFEIYLNKDVILTLSNNSTFKGKFTDIIEYRDLEKSVAGESEKQKVIIKSPYKAIFIDFDRQKYNIILPTIKEVNCLGELYPC